MQFDSIHAIKQRAARLGLGAGQLAGLAGLHRATVYRAWAAGTATAKTISRLEAGLAAREAELLELIQQRGHHD